MARYSIKDLEHLSGIKAHTIRIWEKRYNLLSPERTDTNIRYYSDDDLRHILNVAMLVKHGYKISKVARYDGEKLQGEVLRIDQQTLSVEEQINRLVVAMVNFDTLNFENLLNQFIDQLGFEEAMQLVIFPFFHKIGLFWQVGSIYAAHEHFVSNLVRNRLIRETVLVSDTGKSILFFLREGEWHELGLLFYNYVAASDGLRNIYLGQSLPLADLCSIAQRYKFDYLCTWFVQSIEPEELWQYLSDLAQLFRSATVLISGSQLDGYRFKLPANVRIVKDAADFKKAIW